MSDNPHEQVRRIFRASLVLKQRVMEEQTPTIVAIAARMSDTLAQGGKLLLCGNGGSAADAQHLAAEMLIRLTSHTNREALPALALATDTSSLTACGNDYGFEIYYERMVQALGVRGDMLVGLSTSGASPNIVRALHAARQQGLTTVGLLGGDGGAALAACDMALVVPSRETGRVQEVHITVAHALMDLVETTLLARGVLTRASIPYPPDNQ